MTPECLHVTLRRSDLHAALATLRPLDVVVLLDLVAHSHPRAGRVWTTTERISADLGLSDRLTTEILDRLVGRGFVARIPSRPPILSLEVLTLLVREGEAPENLPVEQPAI